MKCLENGGDILYLQEKCKLCGLCDQISEIYCQKNKRPNLPTLGIFFVMLLNVIYLLK